MIPKRPTRNDKRNLLFDIEPDWRSEWWGMPEFSMADASPQHRITINFMTSDDVKEFAKVTGIPVTPGSDSGWFPHQQRLSGAFEWDGPKTDSRYPVCIPSKGRWDVQTTGRILDRLGVSYRFFVEETEADKYIAALGASRVVSMPFHDLGQGSIPARNFIWEWAKNEGFKRHWTLDDNIQGFVRTTNNRRLRVRGGGVFNAMEDFVDRYQNVAMAGPHHLGFVPDREARLTPYVLNSRVYSCILLDTSLPHRWRGRYNEDTDLSLRLLKDGYCTMLFRALCMDKAATVGVKGHTAMKGGNTDNVYNTGDSRLSFAESLRDQHPDVVSVVWKFNRWHHSVNYEPFRGNRLLRRDDITPTQSINNYGIQLVRTKEAEGQTTILDVITEESE